MKNLFSLTLLILSLGIVLPASSLAVDKAAPKKEKPKPTPKVKKEKAVSVKIETSLGSIVVELDSEKAPITVKNFLNYVERKFYDDLVFHRVIKDFMIQGGGFDKDLKLRPTDAPIKNEASNGLKNMKGTIAMARTPDPNSASSQFFINLKDNDFLNYKGPLPADAGYAVFGKVSEGLDVVEKIGAVKTSASGQMRDVPAEPVIIKSIRKVEDKK